jgi:hypothetical protein
LKRFEDVQLLKRRSLDILPFQFSILNESMQIKFGKGQQAFVRKFTHERVPSVLFIKDRELITQTCLANPTATALVN